MDLVAIVEAFRLLPDSTPDGTGKPAAWINPGPAGTEHRLSTTLSNAVHVYWVAHRAARDAQDGDPWDAMRERDRERRAKERIHALWAEIRILGDLIVEAKAMERMGFTRKAAWRTAMRDYLFEYIPGNKISEGVIRVFVLVRAEMAKRDATENRRRLRARGKGIGEQATEHGYFNALYCVMNEHFAAVREALGKSCQ